LIIYKVTNKINGKAYIGQTVFSLKNRKNRHVSETLNRKDNIYFHKAIRKYGSENFDWKILQKCDTIEELNKLEIHYIELYDTFNNGYNLTKGGKGAVGYVPSRETRKKISEFRTGMNFSEETKRKISEGNKGKKHPMWGKKHPEETKQKISEALKGRKHPMYGKRGKGSVNYGRKHSKDSKLKMSESTRGKKHPMYGKTHSEETKKKMSEAKKNIYIGKNNPNARPVIINNEHFDTRKEAAKYLNVVPATVRNRIKRQVSGYQYA
jgi:group I intron endonuclease